MSTANNDVQFEPLPLKARTLANKDVSSYSVRDVSGEERKIKANTAYEAFRASGLKNTIKIERTFNLSGNILDKSKLIEDAGQNSKKGLTGGAKSEDTLHDRLKLRRNPIISANELDELMRMLRDKSNEQAAAQKSESLLSSDGSSNPASLQMGSDSNTGIEIHGDGFDEIIPASSAKPVTALKPTEPKQAPTTSATESVIEPVAPQELSPEEVEKLLGGK